MTITVRLPPVASPAKVTRAQWNADTPDDVLVVTLTGILKAMDGVVGSAGKILRMTGEEAASAVAFSDFACSLAALGDAAEVLGALAAAPIYSPNLEGAPTAPTPLTGDRSTRIATTYSVGAVIDTAISALVASSPATLDTLNELAAALGNDGNFAASMATALGLKAPLNSPALTGAPTAPTVAGTSDNSAAIATTAFVQAVVAALAGFSGAYADLTGKPTLGTASAEGVGYFATAAQGAKADALSGRNALMNGDFRINQRAYVSAATLAAGSYGHDRWKAGASGGDYSFAQLPNATQITIAVSKTLIQVVEDKNVVGGSYVLSWEGTAQARVGVNSATPAGTYAASPILITGQTAGTTMSVEFDAGTLGKVQLELGAVVTPFERRDYGREMMLCQRYYLRRTTSINGSGTATGVSSYCIWAFPVSMRAAPTTTGASTTLATVSPEDASCLATAAYAGWPIGSTASAEL